MKKFTAFLTAAVLLLSVSGCGTETEKVKRKDGATLQADMSLAYITEKSNGKYQGYFPALQTKDGVLLVRNSSGRDRLTHWNPQTGEYTDIERPNADKRYGESIAFRMTGDRIGVMYEQKKANKWDLDVEAIIEVYDAQLNYTKTIEIPALDGDMRLSYAMDTASGTDYLVFEYYYFDVEGSIKTAAYNLETGEVTDIDGGGYGVISGTSGATYNVGQSGDSLFLSRIDMQSGRLEQITLEGVSSQQYSDFKTGSGEYELYLITPSGVKGVKISGNTAETEKVMNMSASDIMSDMTGWNLCASPDGQFVIRQEKDLWISRKRNDEEMENTKGITLAGVYLTDYLKDIVINYNRTHEDYHIFMVDYMDYVYEGYSDYNYSKYGFEGGSPVLYGITDPTNLKYDRYMLEAVELFRQDLQNGIAPDIICTDNLPYVQFANKGLFLDMTELMEQDERFNPDDYMMNFFDSMKYQGQQQTIAFSFYLNTIIGETELTGDKQGRTAAEFKTLLQSMPEGMYGFGYTREQFQDEFLTYMQNSFLDTETKTCSFDDSGFAALLELGSGLMTMEEWDELCMNSENGKYTVYPNYEGGMLLDVRSFNEAANYHENYGGMHAFRDITLVGFPTTDGGNGGMFSAPYQLAINAMSAYPEVIWDIFMGMLEEETQKKLDVNNYKSFPVLRSALEEDLMAVTKGPNRYYYIDDMAVSIGAITEEEQASLLDYMEHVNMFYYADPTVSTIIQEEVDMYFAGDQTAQEAANKIQSRASLYISEQY